MSISTPLRRAIAVAALAASSLASADPFDLSKFSLAFTTPTGTALATDDIDVYLTLTLSAEATESFLFDGNAGAPYGIGELLPVQGTHYDENGVPSYSDFVEYQGANLGTWFGCGSNFTNGQCPSESFTYGFDWGPAEPATLALNPGDTFTYHFGTFKPKGGAVPAGTYSFSYASLAVFIRGVNAEGEDISTDISLADTSNSTPFTRTVTAVPEPETFALAVAGLFAVGLMVRRRSAG